MAANVNQARIVPVPVGPEIPFLDQHFTKIAFAISTVVLLIFTPSFLFIGALAGLSLHYSIEPQLVLTDQTEVVTLSHAVLSIVGAVAALIRVFPAGAAGGIVFQSIPLLGSFAVGSAAYRALGACSF